MEMQRDNKIVKASATARHRAVTVAKAETEEWLVKQEERVSKQN